MSDEKTKNKEKRLPKKCPFLNCSAIFYHGAKLQRHIGSCHSSERPFKCTVVINNVECNKSYKRKEHLKRHLLTHKNERLFKCHFPGCNLKFNVKHHVPKHFKCVHGPPQYQCDFCTEKFQKKRHLKKHMALKHNELCPFVCNECNRRFSRECDLKRHKHKRMHIELESSSNGASFIGVCDECHQTFKDKSLYRKHLKQHLKEQKKKRIKAKKIKQEKWSKKKRNELISTGGEQKIESFLKDVCGKLSQCR